MEIFKKIDTNIEKQMKFDKISILYKEHIQEEEFRNYILGDIIMIMEIKI